MVTDSLLTLSSSYDVVMPCISRAAKWFEENGHKNPQDPKNVPFQQAFNAEEMEIFPWLFMPENQMHFNSANEFFEGDRGSRPSWVKWFPVEEKLLPGFREDEGNPLLVDVAGGRGHDILEFEKQFPDAKGRLVLQDIQPVLDSAEALSSRIEKRAIDFFTEAPIPGLSPVFVAFFCVQHQDSNLHT